MPAVTSATARAGIRFDRSLRNLDRMTTAQETFGRPGNMASKPCRNAPLLCPAQAGNAHGGRRLHKCHFICWRGRWQPDLRQEAKRADHPTVGVDEPAWSGPAHGKRPVAKNRAEHTLRGARNCERPAA